MLQDIDDLPYVQALIREVLTFDLLISVYTSILSSPLLICQTHRWRPVAPLGLPHATIEDLPYKWYIIPRGSVIYVNNCK